MRRGIYAIRNTVNGKSYVGFATDIDRRWSKHKWGLKRNTHDNPKLQAAWNKYGKDAFTFEILEICSADKLLLREHFYALQLKVHTEGYNIHPTGEEGQTFRAIETKNKISQRLSGRTLSDEHKKNIAKSLTGKKLSEQTKQKIGAKTKGKTSSRKGVVLSQETKDKIGRPHSEQEKQKMKDAWKRRKEKQNSL